ncbi:hypothetical protein A2U01_0116916, partial [Trifolium medium]|nr:hypothetical protein [Trifolium medium]
YHFSTVFATHNHHQDKSYLTGRTA